MHNLTLFEIKGIIRTYLKPAGYLNRKIFSFFRKRFNGDFIVLDKGRSAMQACIDDFDLKDGEIILPSWICADVFAPLFITNNITPRIVDSLKGSLKMNLNQVRSQINKKTRALLVVHTYGVPQDLNNIKKICKESNILLIEDCAHCINLKDKEGYYGSFGDASIFSFVKEIPCFSGGLYINNKRDIKESIKNNIQKSSFSLMDLKIIFHKIFPTKVSSTKRNKEDYSIINVVPRKMSKLAKAFFCHLIDNLDIESKRKSGLLLIQALPKGYSLLSSEEIEKGSAKCLPIKVQDKEEKLISLINLGLNPGKGWIPSMSTYPANSNSVKTPIAENYEKTIINLDLDEINKENVKDIVDILTKKRNY